MGYQYVVTIICGISSLVYFGLYRWSNDTVLELAKRKNAREISFEDYESMFKKDRGMPFLFLSIVLPVVLGCLASYSIPPEVAKSASAALSVANISSISPDDIRSMVNGSISIVDAILVTLVTLELAYWSGANSARCAQLIQAAFYVDITVLIALLVKGPAKETDICTLWQLPLIFLVGATSVFSSYRCIYKAALWDRFEFGPPLESEQSLNGRGDKP